MKRSVLTAILMAATMLFSTIGCRRQPTESTPPPADTATTTGSLSTEAVSTTSGTATGQVTDIPAPGKTSAVTTGVATTDAPAQTTPAELPTYQNPVIPVTYRNSWPRYGVGDPFVMRWNGRYYMYCSTKDGSDGIQVWTSDDLVRWSYVTLCATEPLTNSAYAPEVVYYNGAFYMYTSPAGNGHYVLKSTSPTGPFKAVTDNFGLSIDGNVFIDDDGKWYFYHAGLDSIVCHPMTAPHKVDVHTAIQTGSYMNGNGWTEGPMVLKYNGIYYMTYCGNHVWCPGYRINYATSRTDPTVFTPAANNPVLISTSKEVHGIGHNSIVLSPDLDGYYMVYHSYTTVPLREMNIDRIVLNGTRMEVLGPTTSRQEAPAMPDVYSHFDTEAALTGWKATKATVKDGRLQVSKGGRVVSEARLQGNYTAEFNLLSLEKEAGALFGYTDERNYGSACYNASTGQLTVRFTVNGKETAQSVKVAGSFGETLDKNALILLTVRHVSGRYTFFVNNRQVLTAKSSLSGGAIGVTATTGKAAFGFVGASGEADQSAVKRLHKPVAGTLPAITCTEKAPPTTTVDTVSYVTAAKGQSYTYLTNVADAGSYDLTVAYRASKATTLEVYQENTRVGQITLSPASGDATALTRGLPLTAGMGAVRFRVTAGEAQILSYTFTRGEAVQTLTCDFSDTTVPFAYADGVWVAENGKLTLREGYGKCLFGASGWGDYTVEADVTVTPETRNFGLLVRVTNPSDGGEGKAISAGTDFLQGYFIGIGDGSVLLGKQHYAWTPLHTAAADIRQGQTYRIKVEAVGATIRVWVDGKPVIDYTDTDAPFLHGMVGFRGHDSAGFADNFTVTPVS